MIGLLSTTHGVAAAGWLLVGTALLAGWLLVALAWRREPVRVAPDRVALPAEYRSDRNPEIG